MMRQIDHFFVCEHFVNITVEFILKIVFTCFTRSNNSRKIRLKKTTRGQTTVTIKLTQAYRNYIGLLTKKLHTDQ